MNSGELRKHIKASELIFSTSRSSGPGGQNVNKVNTKVELRFNILKSESLSEDEKEKILSVLKNKITAKGDLLIISQSARAQLLNRQIAEDKLCRLLSIALREKPERKATSPTVASSRERVENKRKRSSLKKLRRESGSSDEG
ncbi:MAG: alternative ribosome rescue aminoacyl-tRNA hydrolase ArfB [Bacteroidales bacterium]